MEKNRYIIGIDLGTTNSVLSYIDLENEEQGIETFSIPQLVKAGKVDSKNTLPSFIYLPGEHELSPKNLALPWNKKKDYCVGEFARVQGGQVSNRLVSSAKSWLCHQGVDRSSNILPFQATEDVSKISPLEASSRYLLHLKEAWNHEREAEDALEKQCIYLTVPASFDAVARELTVQAAKNVGLEVTLLEEPLAAFYAWLYQYQEQWRQELEVGDLILVVDVGGGTSDFSLISAREEEGNLILEREAVGDHILLGGDNMDITLAHLVSQKLPKQKLDAWQSVSLWHSCREAKEKILEDESLDSAPVVILGRGSRLIGGSLKTKLTRQEIEDTLLGGFFPQVKSDDFGNTKRVGFTQVNLPYANEPAITRQIARFLNTHSEANPPNKVLFNGGVFKAKVFREQILSVLQSWQKKKELQVLTGNDLDISVAQGAVYYGQAKRGKGIRIRGGTAHSYYLGIESSRPAIPGIPIPMKAMCVVPGGMEEGSQADIPESQLALTVGEPVIFPFYSSSKRKEDEIGSMSDYDESSFNEVASLETTLKAEGKIKEGENIPVKLHSKVTEVGTLEISCQSLDKKHQWNLEFNIRKG